MGKLRYSKLATEKQKKKFGNYFSDDEEMILFTRVSNIYLLNKFLMYFLIALLIILPLSFIIYKIFNFDLLYILGAGLILALLVAAQKYYFTKNGISYILTNKKLIVRIGYFKVILYSASFNKITNLEIDQSLFERMFLGYGTIIVRTAGQNSKEIILKYIDSPLEFKNIMGRLIHEERVKYGV